MVSFLLNPGTDADIPIPEALAAGLVRSQFPEFRDAVRIPFGEGFANFIARRYRFHRHDPKVARPDALCENGVMTWKDAGIIEDPRARKELARSWMIQSRHDLAAAMRLQEQGVFDWACFLAQQSVEKILKAIDILENGRTTKGHDLDVLGRRCGFSGSDLDLLKDLTGEYTITRYPDAALAPPCEMYDEEIAAKRLRQAESFLAKFMSRLEPLDAEPK